MIPELLDTVASWSSLLLLVVVFGFAPGFCLRLIVLAYPRHNPRRTELIAELYAVPRIERPLWVAEQLETALFEGLPHRFSALLRWITRPRGALAKHGVAAGFGVVAGLGFGLGSGAIVGLAMGLQAGIGVGLRLGLQDGFWFGLALGLWSGLGCGLVVGSLAGHWAGLVCGLAFGLACIGPCIRRWWRSRKVQNQ